MKLIEGNTVAAAVYSDCHAELTALKSLGLVPGLAVILVGDDPASLAYVGAKERKCQELGLHSEKIELPFTVSQSELIDHIQRLNADPAIHGVLVQMPLPKNLCEQTVIRAISPGKDVDGLHPVNVAKLAMDDPSGFAPCTPLGCQRMLQESGIDVAGKHVVILGRSLLVGKTLALLLMRRGSGADATVTVAHSKSENLPALTRQADILVAAIGRPGLVGADHVKDGAVVLDVGINRIEDPSTKKGYRLVGDVDFDAVAPKCRAITPVPGGVGVMTIAMLMANTIRACHLSRQ